MNKGLKRTFIILFIVFALAIGYATYRDYKEDIDSYEGDEIVSCTDYI